MSLIQPFNVLFLCTGNSARSILAESALRSIGDGRFNAFSAGSHPKGEVHPLAIETLHEANYPVEGLRSKAWEEFAAASAPPHGFCLHCLRPRCWRGVPTVARATIDGALGYRGSHPRSSRGNVATRRLPKGADVPGKPHPSLRRAATPYAVSSSIDSASLRNWPARRHFVLPTRHCLRDPS